MKICSNCGGSFDEQLPKCPYCGMINEVGAEKEYSEKLDNIRKDLDHVDELAVVDYKGDLFTFLRIFLITLLVVGGITFLAVSARFANRNGLLENERANMDKLIAEIREERALTDNWDALYDAGRYDDLYKEVQKEISGGYNFYEWKHYDFYRAYEAFAQANEKRESINFEEDVSPYKKTDALHSVLYAYYAAISSRNVNKFTNHEKELFQKEWEELVKNTCEAFEMTEKDLDMLRIRSSADTYPSYSEVSSYVEERWGK